MALLDQDSLIERPSTGSARRVLSDMEVECIDLFVRVAQFLGLAKSFGELYGYIFLAKAPICLDDCTECLNLSKGAASQGLKQLKSLGAIKLVYVPGDRRDRYVAEESLKYLVAGFLKERVQPGLLDLQQRIENLETKVATLPSPEKMNIQERLHRLQSWQTKAQMILPVVNKLLMG